MAVKKVTPTPEDREEHFAPPPPPRQFDHPPFLRPKPRFADHSTLERLGFLMGTTIRQLGGDWTQEDAEAEITRLEKGKKRK